MGPFSGVQIDGLIANAFEDGAAVAPREVRTRALNNCFGVSMPER